MLNKNLKMQYQNMYNIDQNIYKKNQNKETFYQQQQIMLNNVEKHNVLKNTPPLEGLIAT